MQSIEEQISKYNSIRKSFADPAKVFLKNRANPLPQFNDVSFNFWLTDNLRNAILNNFINQVKKIEPSQDYVTAEMYHCTVKSCGLLGKQLNENQISEIIEQAKEELKDFPKFRIKLRGVNNFPNTIFIQVFSENGELYRLHNTLNSIIPFSEYPEFEGENYTPHIATVYFFEQPETLFKELDKYKSTEFGEMVVESINLIKGGLSPDGHRMEVIERFDLTG
jgi:2'-5' RNA ligase